MVDIKLFAIIAVIYFTLKDPVLNGAVIVAVMMRISYNAKNAKNKNESKYVGHVMQHLKQKETMLNIVVLLVNKNITVQINNSTYTVLKLHSCDYPVY